MTNRDSTLRRLGRAACAAIALGAAATGAATPALAQPLQQVHVHGFGGMSYGKTDHNHFGGGDEHGDYHHSSFSLNLTARFDQRLGIVAQSEWRSTENGTQNQLDYAFADVRFNAALGLRVGQVKQPFGLYAEVNDVGTLRPFFTLPFSVYGPTGAVGEAYRGAGLWGSRTWGRWGIAYDVYGGELTTQVNESGIGLFTDSTAHFEEHTEHTPNFVGGRVVLRLPVNGLSAGVSGFTGRSHEEEEHEGEAGAEAEEPARRRSTLGAQLELEREKLVLRSEVVRHYDPGHDAAITSLGGYAEASYQLTESWQLAGRYDRLYSSLDGIDVSSAPSLMHHTAVGAGVNYWFSPNIVLKSSYQLVDGNRFAGPHGDEIAAAIAAGELQKRTHLVTLGVNFSF